MECVCVYNTNKTVCLGVPEHGPPKWEELNKSTISFASSSFSLSFQFLASGFIHRSRS